MRIDHPPYLYCTACSSDECEWVEAPGPRMISSVVGSPPDDLKNGIELQVVLDQASPDIVLPKWRRRAGDPSARGQG